MGLLVKFVVLILKKYMAIFERILLRFIILGRCILFRREISVDPETDLVPLCSNCHKMIHRKKAKPLTLEELKNKILIKEDNNESN